MQIIGCDLHARQQTLAMLDTISGEVVIRTLMHEDTEAMKRHSTEPVGVNTVQANDRRFHEMQTVARVCPEEANTLEKTLATADLVRDTRQTRT